MKYSLELIEKQMATQMDAEKNQLTKLLIKDSIKIVKGKLAKLEEDLAKIISIQQRK